METASSALSPSAASFTVGGVLSRSFALMFRRFGLFVSLSITAVALSTILTWLLMPLVYTWFPPNRFIATLRLFPYISWAGMLQVFIAGTCTYLFQGAAGWVLFRLDSGDKVTFLLALKALFGNLHHTLGTAAIYSALMAVSAVAYYIPVYVISCFLVASVPSSVVERLGVRASLRRSVDLTRGNRWRILALTFLIGILIAVIQWMYVYCQASLLTSLPGPITGASFLSVNPFVWGSSMILRVLITFLGQVFYAVVYSDLRAARAGGAGGLARVFD